MAHYDYTVLANDFQVGVFLPQLTHLITTKVASFKLTVRPSKLPDIEQLRQSGIDAVFSPFAPNHNDIMSVRLFDDVARCFYDPHHRSPPVTENDFSQARYVGLSFTKASLPVIVINRLSKRLMKER